MVGPVFCFRSNMSRGRKRKTDKGSFTEEAMRRAVQAVLVGVNGKKLSLRQAAAENGLKFQTLQRYVKKEQLNPEGNVRMAPKYQSRLVFSMAEEKSLSEYMIQCSNMCYGKSTKDFRELAYEMGKLNNNKTPDSWEVNKKAGIDWMQGFLKRHPELSIRQPEGCSISRATSFNEHNVSKFFENLKNTLSRSDKFADGSRIYNLDETSTTTVQRPKKVLASKGSKQVSQCTSGERGILVTTCCIISASGNTLPPAMVFPRKNFKAHMTNGAPPGTLGLATNSGWMTSEVFPLVMRHFIKYSGSTKDNPTILIYDNHESHLTIETLNLAKENGVTIVTLPPHCSNKLQPLDVCVFYSFKAHYNAAVDSWMLCNPGIPMTIYQVGSCVGLAHERSMTPSNIKAGFKKTGIYPFDSEVFTTGDFLTSYVTDRNYDNETATVSINGSELTVVHDSIVEECEEPSPLCTSVSIQSSDDSRPNQGNSKFISPHIFKGFPKAGVRKGARKGRNKASSCIPTDTPEKEKIQKKLEERDSRKRKSSHVSKQLFFCKKKQQQEQEFIISDNEDELQISSSSESSDDTDQPPEEQVNPSCFQQLDRDPKQDDFVLVEFKGARDIFYIAKVISSKDKNDDIEVSFLRKCVKNEGYFSFPNVSDIALIPVSDIKMLLPTPKLLGSTKRLQSFYKFELNFDLINIR